MTPSDTREDPHDLALVRARAALCRAAEGGIDTVALHEDLHAVFRAHTPRMYRLCLRLTGDAALAKDLTTRAWALAVHKLPSYGEQRAWVWLFSLTRALALDSVRILGDPLLIDGVLTARAPAYEALRICSLQHRSALIGEAARPYGEREQEALHLRYVERLPTAIIGRMIPGFPVRSLAEIRETFARRLIATILG